MGGDFNIDWARKFDSSYPSSNLLALLEEWADNHSMSQLIRDPTRHRVVNTKNYTRHEQSCIDLLFVSDSDYIKSELVPGISSDHDVIVATVENGPARTVRSKVCLRDWRNYTQQKILELALARPIIFSSDSSIDEWSSTIDNVLLGITDEVAPFRVIKLNNERELVNSRVSALKKKRDRMIKKARKNGSAIARLNAHLLSRTLKSVIKKEKHRIAKVKSRTSDSQGFWKLVVSYTGRNSLRGIVIKNGVNAPLG